MSRTWPVRALSGVLLAASGAILEAAVLPADVAGKIDEVFAAWDTTG